MLRSLFIIAMLTALLSSRGQAQSEPLLTGISGVTRGKLVLTIPPDRPPHGSLRYSLAFPFQVGPQTMGIMALRMIHETHNYGYLAGTDVILLDELKPPHPDQIFAISRNEMEPVKAGATPRIRCKGPLMGGFVPLGALRADGSPHPHAGTGFGACDAHSRSFPDNRFVSGDPTHVATNECFQFAYDGKKFTSRRTRSWSQDEKEPYPIGDTGWTIQVIQLTYAIPDEDDLLIPSIAARIDGSAKAVGVVRWKRVAGDWQPVEFDPVVSSQNPHPKEPGCPWTEPSLARDADGALLFSARGDDCLKDEAPRLGYTLRVWRSTKPGQWDLLFNDPQARLNSPVSVNVAADGSAYLVSSPYDVAFIPETGKSGRGREKLVLWPLTGSRTGLERALLIRDCLADFGAPTAQTLAGTELPEKWMADHPNGVTVRLKDGQWHHLLAYRLCHSPRWTSYGTPPSPHTGSYLEEVTTRGPQIPTWNFAK